MSRPFGESDVKFAMLKQYSKKYALKDDSHTDCVLPPCTELFVSNHWKDAKLMSYKEKLNAKKSELNDLDLSSWHQHTRSTNHAGLVISTVKKEINPELLTQAWCKFYEMVSSYDLITKSSKQSGSLRSLHLCEAPGAFITSLNHYLRINFPDIKWKWLGTTLNPHYEGNQFGEMLNDDRLIQHVLNQWYFGNDGTGDIFNQENIFDLIKCRKFWSPINLITCDGSIDCQGDPGEQESLVSPLHYCEAIVALSLLSHGGNMVIKMFTILETSSVCLLFLLCCTFRFVDVYKPATSKEGNSEVYVICRDFIGRHQISDTGESRSSQQLSQALFILLKNYGPDIVSGAPLFQREHIPDTFIDRMRECSNFFISLQIDVIERNLYLYKNQDPAKTSFIKRVRWAVAKEFTNLYSLKPINPKDQIVGNQRIRNWVAQICFDERKEQGSFTQRCEMKTESPKFWAQRIKGSLEKHGYVWKESEQSIEFDSMMFFTEDIRTSNRMVSGKPITVIHNSKFCLGSILTMWNSMLKFSGTSPKVDSLLKSIKEIAGEAEICDLTTIDTDCWNEAWLFLRKAVFTLYRHLVCLSPGQNFIISGLPLVTRLAVSLLHLIGTRFTKVALCNPEKYGYAVIFYKLRERDVLIADMEYVKKYINNSDYSLHSLFLVSQICAGPLYEAIVNVNHIFFSYNTLVLANKELNN